MLNILYEPKEHQYKNLLDFCLKFSTKFMFKHFETIFNKKI